MELLQKLQEKIAKSAQAQSGQLSQQDLAKMQKELEQALEQMAKQYGSDEEIKKLAQEMLEAAKRAKELKECSSCAGGSGHKGHAGFG
ncbi:MAG: hypothetical protein HY318_00605 [Armatimonadetes bacterium]|nr:hypothetical protein [Armatimonadota bacterium]